MEAAGWPNTFAHDVTSPPLSYRESDATKQGTHVQSRLSSGS